jgi:hypothetical protein
MPRNADLYLDRIAFDRYTSGESCELCRVDSLDELVDRLRHGEIPTGPCAHWPPERVTAFCTALDAAEFLPEVPALELPRPVEQGLFELNPPTEKSPLLVTGNSEFTQAVLLAVISRTSSPLRVLFTDTHGHTVDMAMVFQVLTAERVATAVEQVKVEPSEPSRIVLPGLAGAIAPALSNRLNRPVEVGPVCAAELSLYMGDDWIPTQYQRKEA